MQSPLHSYLAQAHSPDDLPDSEAEEIDVQVHDLVKKKKKKSNAHKVKDLVFLFNQNLVWGF